MVSTRLPSRAEQVASNAWLRADGGCIFEDAPNAVISAAATVHQISTLRNIAPRRVTRLSRVSSRASGGFMTIVKRNSSPARSFPLLTAIRWINRCPDRPNGCLQTGKRCFTNRARAPRSAAPFDCLNPQERRGCRRPHIARRARRAARRAGATARCFRSCRGGGLCARPRGS
jgi:hypothetical protein